METKTRGEIAAARRPNLLWRFVPRLEQSDFFRQMMNGPVGLLRAGFQQIVKSFVVSEKSSDRKYKRFQL
jgi:hypothetical protein